MNATSFNVHMDATLQDWKQFKELAERFGISVKEEILDSDGNPILGIIDGAKLFVNIREDHYSQSVSIHDATYSRTIYRTSERTPKELDKPQQVLR